LLPAVLGARIGVWLFFTPHWVVGAWLLGSFALSYGVLLPLGLLLRRRFGQRTQF
jgi:hypothetical protein